MRNSVGRPCQAAPWQGVSEINMNDESKKELSISLPGEWVLQKTFGPVLGELGEDMKKLYAGGRDRILKSGYKKVSDPDDGKVLNLRVTRDIFWNGAYSESEICAEYFGGMLASSRSEDGEDDSVLQFVDVVKSLSSKQLALHYTIYTVLNKVLVASGKGINVGLSSEIQKEKIFFATMELDKHLKLDTDTNLNILHRQGLLNEYRKELHMEEKGALPFVSCVPTTFGILLYCASHNSFKEWRQFGTKDFGEFDGVELPNHYAQDIKTLANKFGLVDNDKTETNDH